jgi:ectoine hydroxylase-related dioxygenase (phytanoyl-CoA dioxygenase family)
MQQRFLFDCLGYSIASEVVGEAQLAELHGAIDDLDPWRRIDRCPEATLPTDGWVETSDSIVRYVNRFDHLDLQCGPVAEWSGPLGALTESPSIQRLVENLLAPSGFYLDHASLALSRQGAPGLELHGGAFENDPRQRYQFHVDRIDPGCVIVVVSLVHVQGGLGGTVVVPGSHKANLVPDSLPAMEDIGRCTWAHCPTLQPGDALVLPEALLHGAAPWRLPWERRAIVLKFYPNHIANLDYVPRSAMDRFWP